MAPGGGGESPPAPLNPPNLSPAKMMTLTYDTCGPREDGGEFDVPVKGGNTGIMIANIYGHSGASSDDAAYRSNGTLLAAAIMRAMQFHHTPYLIMGDIHIQPHETQVVTQALRNNVVHDITEEWAPRSTGPPPTYRREGVAADMDGVGTTRIDVVLANQAGAVMVTRVEYLWEDAAGFDHVPIQVTLNYKAFHYTHQTIAKSKPTNIQDIKDQKWKPNAMDELYRDLWRGFHQQYHEAIAAHQVQTAHIIWCQTFQQYLDLLQTPGARESAKTVRPSKGQAMPIVNTTVTARFSEQFMSEDNRAVQVARKLIGHCKRLCNYVKGILKRENHNQQTDNILRQYIAKVNELRQQNETTHNYTVEALENLIEKTEASAKHQAAENRKTKHKQLRDRLTNCRTGVADTCKFIKEGYKPRTTVLYDPATGAPTADPARVQELFLEHFQPVYETHRTQPPVFTKMSQDPDFAPHFKYHQEAPQ